MQIKKKLFIQLIFILVLIEAVLHFTTPFLRLDQNTSVWYAQWVFPEFDKKNSGVGLYYAHPYSSYAMKPNIDGRTNNLGFRGSIVSFDKPKGVYRIVCVGGSTIYGARNQDKYTIPKLLEGYLVKVSKKKIEVINAGLLSGTTMETFNILCFRVIPLKPDLIIIYQGFNDLVPRIANNFQNDYSHFRKIPLRPFYSINKYLNNLYIVRYLKLILNKDENLHDYTFNYENIPDNEAEKTSNFYKSGPEAFKNHMEMMIKLLQAYNIPVVVPTFAYQEGLNDYWVKVFPEKLWGVGITQNNSSIQELTVKYNLANVDLYKFCLGKKEFFSGKIHFNNRGSAEVSRFLGERIIEAFPEIIK